jgi:hypothetical protein
MYSPAVAPIRRMSVALINRKSVPQVVEGKDSSLQVVILKNLLGGLTGV